MDALSGWLARVVVWMEKPRRRALLLTGIVVGWLVGPPVLKMLLGDVLIIRDPVLEFAAGLLSYTVLIAGATVITAVATGFFRGRPLPLPARQLMRVADQHYRNVTSWTAPVSRTEVVDRLADLEVRGLPVSVHVLPDGLYVRARFRFQPEPWPASAPIPRPVDIGAGVLILVTTITAGRSTIDAHWDSADAGGPIDVLREHERLGRDVVDAARAVTTDVRGPIDAPGGSAGRGAG